MKTLKRLFPIISAMIFAFGAANALGAESEPAGPDHSILTPARAESVHSADVYFGFEMAEMTPEAFSLVKELAGKFKAGQYREVILIGHADTAEENPDELSRQRAETVRDALTALGIDGFDISVEGWGIRGQPYPRGAGVREPMNRPVEVHFIELRR
jgi:outer membrane protein OmpA-like peptidoglycan-associated protein